MTSYTSAELTEDVEARARELADEIKARQSGLEREEALLIQRGPRTRYARAKRDRDAERSLINGMVIALTCILGRPNDMQLAEAFIDGKDYWRALL